MCQVSKHMVEANSLATSYKPIYENWIFFVKKLNCCWTAKPSVLLLVL